MIFHKRWILFLITLLIFAGYFWSRGCISENVAVGQVKHPPLKMITATKDCLIYHVPVLYQDIPSFKPERPKWLKRFTNDYREYSAECYADSNYVWCDSVRVYGMSETSWQFPSKIIWREWIHREPTLPGFMQFLEEKYKQ